VHTPERGTHARRGKTCRRGDGPRQGEARDTMARSSDMLRDSRCVGTDVHTHERGTYARRGKPCRRGMVFGRATRVKVCRRSSAHTWAWSIRSQGQALPSWRCFRARARPSDVRSLASDPTIRPQRRRTRILTRVGHPGV
jgi:hypothetical protein